MNSICWLASKESSKKCKIIGTKADVSKVFIIRQGNADILKGMPLYTEPFLEVRRFFIMISPHDNCM